MSKRHQRILSIALALGLVTSVAAPSAAYGAFHTGPSGSLYAEERDEKYTVTVVNGYNKTAQETFAEGDRVAVSTVESSEGMVFVGWSSSGGGTFDDPWSTSTIFHMPAQNVTLTANFIRVDHTSYYNVTFDLNGGTLAKQPPKGWEQEGDILKVRVREGDTVLPPAVYRFGFTLKGWGQPVEEIKGDTAYKAEWTREGTGYNPQPDPDETEPSNPDPDKPDTSNPDSEKPDSEKPAGYTWEKNADGYILKAPDGSYVSGWAKVDGKWYYCKSGVMQTGWLPLGSAWYYLAPSGQMATGWQQVGNAWYYLSGSGAMKTGWLQLGNTWYYLTPSGKMATGWQQVGNAWYYLSGSGAMKTGWLQLGNTWYYLTPSGKMATGWNWIDGKCYYFYESGKMAANTTIGGYRLNKSGQWVR